MSKFLMLAAFLSLTVVNNCYGQMQPSTDDSLKNDSSDGLTLPKDGQYHIYGSPLNLLLGASFVSKRSVGFASNSSVGKTLDADYVVTPGIGAHKLHLRKVSWIKAEKTCIGEGGHLAVIRTELEEKILLGMIAAKSIDFAWLGYHDMFEEGAWFSVLGEPLAETGWSRWSTMFPTNPIPGNGHCGELVNGTGGLVNKDCQEKRSFICKISIVQ